MLLNLASDVPFIYKNGSIEFLDRKNLEEQLPLYLKNNLRNKEIYIINGPGYFSSTRVGVEIINILLALGVLENVYYLNKIDFFSQIVKENIYLFTGNKNKFIDLKTKEIILKKDLNFNFSSEELFELKIEGLKYISYISLLENYKLLKWNSLDKNTLLRPFYIFEPIVC